MIRQHIVATHIVATMALIGVAACTSVSRSYVVADDACVTYGFHVGTPEYRLCGEREAKVAGSGRVLEGLPPVR